MGQLDSGIHLVEDEADVARVQLAQTEKLAVVTQTTLSVDDTRDIIAALERRFQQVFVGEPSVESTIAILRGLKERYEVHHAVDIEDPALVAAAVLSDRYLTGRFLPDKAIDLVDEASARLRMQVDSKPEELDSIDREIVRLKIEQEALKKESDAGSKERLRRLEGELSDLETRSAAITATWKAEKDSKTN